MSNEKASTNPRPVGPYAVLMALYCAMTGVLIWRLRSRPGQPTDVRSADILLLGVATHKLTRTISKEKVTAPLRAPFTEFEGPAGPGEVSESPRGTGLRYAIGELLICPYCIAHWVATGLLGMFAVAPRAARLVAAVFAVVTISDFLQIAYKVSEDKL